MVHFIDGRKIETVKSYTYLGIDVTNTGNFQKACKSLYQKSLRAMFSLYSAISPRSDIPSSKLFLKLSGVFCFWNFLYVLNNLNNTVNPPVIILPPVFD